MGHELVNIDNSAARSVRMSELVAELQDVDWNRGKHWDGIAGKFTPKGAFSVGGSKETAYAVFDALTDRKSASYARVRQGSVVEAAE